MPRGRRKTLKAKRDELKDYYQEHREERLAYANDYYQKNRDRILERIRERRLNDPDFAERQRAYHRRYYRKKRKNKTTRNK